VKKAGLALSGIVIKGRGGPTLNRTFAAGEPIGFSIQIARLKDDGTAVTLRYLVKDALGQPITNLDVPRNAQSVARNGVETRDFVVRAPAARGAYVVALEASDGQTVARREVPLTVR
jgi:hypothetical protein